jgi:hypothetical protein
MTREEMERAVLEGQVREGLAKEAASQREPEDKYSLKEAAARGFADMGSWGTASKVEGAIQAARDVGRAQLRHLTGDDENEDQTLYSMGIGGGLKEAYKAREGLANDRYKESAAEHPIATIAGGLPGAVMAPGSSLFAPAKAAEGASAIARVGNTALNVGKAAGMGATYGAGSSRHNVFEQPKEFAEDVGVGAGGGVAGYGVGSALGKAAPLVVRGGGKIGRALGNVAFGVPS